MRTVIDDRGRFRWQLAVTPPDVTASLHHPGCRSIYVSTADLETDAPRSKTGCAPAEVVTAYWRRSSTDRSLEELLAAVRSALTDDAAASREVVV